MGLPSLPFVLMLFGLKVFASSSQANVSISVRGGQYPLRFVAQLQREACPATCAQFEKLLPWHQLLLQVLLLLAACFCAH